MRPLCLLVLFSVAMVGQALTPSSFLSTVDRGRLSSLFQASVGQQDLPSVAYSILGYKLLGETAPNAGEACKKLQAGVESSDVSAAGIYQASTAAKALGNSCSLKLGSQANKVLTASLASESSVANLYYGVLTQLSLGQRVDGSQVLKSLLAALKKDDSLANLGYAFHVASKLAGVDVSAIFDRIEDAVVQADEIDGKLLQFEGGLTVSSLIVTGAYELAAHAKVSKAPPIGRQQAVKFANYFLSRRSVQQPKGAFHLLSALQALSKANKHHVPVSVSLASAPTVSESSPKVKVQVTDLLGQSLGKMDVVVESAMRQSDGAVVMAKSKMTSLSDTMYESDMMKAKPGKGFYELTINAIPAKADARLVGNEGAVLLVKALGTIAIEGVEVGVADADQSTAPKTTKATYPQKLAKTLEADHHHKVVVKFALKDKASGEKVKVHQAFVRLASGDSEIVYVAEADANSQYKFDLDVSAKAKEFGSKSGTYGVHLVIGDAVISNPMSWHLADLKLTFQDASSPVVESKKDKVKPEIRHLFREPEKRPPAVVSNAFTVLCLLPFLVMIVCWMKLGVNISSFPFSVAALGFHVGLGAIFALYYYFWVQLDMFTTLKYLIMAGVVTFLCGNSMLVKIAEKRKGSQQ